MPSYHLANYFINTTKKTITAKNKNKNTKKWEVPQDLHSTAHTIQVGVFLSMLVKYH